MSIQDFGQKIGGAKKDLWKDRGLTVSDISEFTNDERLKHVKKDNIWLKPDYEALKNDGYSADALYFIKSVRDAMPGKPQIGKYDDEEVAKNKCETYIKFVGEIKNELLQIKTNEDIDKFDHNFFVKYGYAEKGRYNYKLTQEGNAIYTKKLWNAVAMNKETAHELAVSNEFFYSYEDKVKAAFKVHELDGVKNMLMTDGNRPYVQMRSLSGYSYAYPPFVDEDKQRSDIYNKDTYQKNTFFVTHDRSIIGAGFNSQESAQKFVDMCVNTLVTKHEAEIAATQDKSKDSTDKEEKAKRKTALKPPQLKDIKRTGPDKNSEGITGQDFIDTFKIRGGEFGNWLDENDRQVNMNMAFDAFKDLAKALNIPESDIAIGGKLNIAFGARGSGSALAHYETDREVINLTKMKGAGSLAHEYFHALDNMLGKDINKSNSMATERAWSVPAAVKELVDAMKHKEIIMSEDDQTKEKQEYLNKSIDKFKKEMDVFVPDRVLDESGIAKKNELVNALIEKAKEPEFSAIQFTSTPRSRNLKQTANPVMKELFDFIDAHSPNYRANQNNQLYLASKLDSVASANHSLNEVSEPKKVRVATDFYKNAEIIDNSYSKSGHGYWSSNIELAARAFACYIKDKLAEQGIKNDYLTGHAEYAPIPHDGKLVLTYPVGEERETINKAIDKFIDCMKERGLLHNLETVQEQNKGHLDDILNKCAAMKQEQQSTKTNKDKDFER